MSSPGVRFERLLFWAAPITLAAIAVFITTLGYNTQEDRVLAKCLESASYLIEGNEEKLSRAWRLYGPHKNNKSSSDIYIYEKDVKLTLITREQVSCFEYTIHNKDLDLGKPPAELTQNFRSKAKSLNAKPIVMYGIEIPERATLSLAGTKIQISMVTFIQALQISLAPVLLLWLGSLYHTRLREIILCNEHDNLVSVHPHVINVYPVGHYPALRKRNFWKKHTPKLIGAFYLFLRLCLLGIFVIPPVALYIGSLTYHPIFGYWILNVIIGISLATYSVSCFALETQVMNKYFLGPTALR